MFFSKYTETNPHVSLEEVQLISYWKLSITNSTLWVSLYVASARGPSSATEDMFLAFFPRHLVVAICPRKMVGVLCKLHSQKTPGLCTATESLASSIFLFSQPLRGTYHLFSLQLYMCFVWGVGFVGVCVCVFCFVTFDNHTVFKSEKCMPVVSSCEIFCLPRISECVFNHKTSGTCLLF